MSGDDPFSRWSKRRRAVAEEEARAQDAAHAAEEASAEAIVPSAPDETEADLLARLDLKPPEELQQGDDFSAYLQAAVPEAIRKRALRVLWRSNPTLACLDGLNDYDDDYTGGGVAPGALKTAYKVGRGLLDRAAELEAERAAAAEDAPEPAALADAGEEVDEAEPTQDLTEIAPDDDPPAPTRRRMVFRPKNGSGNAET